MKRYSNVFTNRSHRDIHASWKWCEQGRRLASSFSLKSSMQIAHCRLSPRIHWEFLWENEESVGGFTSLFSCYFNGWDRIDSSFWCWGWSTIFTHLIQKLFKTTIITINGWHFFYLSKKCIEIHWIHCCCSTIVHHTSKTRDKRVSFPTNGMKKYLQRKMSRNTTS